MDSNDVIQPPAITIKFGTCSQTHQEILSVYIKSFQHAINAARGDVKALTDLNRLAKEAVWLTDGLLYDAMINNDK